MGEQGGGIVRLFGIKPLVTLETEGAAFLDEVLELVADLFKFAGKVQAVAIH